MSVLRSRDRDALDVTLAEVAAMVEARHPTSPRVGPMFAIHRDADGTWSVDLLGSTSLVGLASVTECCIALGALTHAHLYGSRCA